MKNYWIMGDIHGDYLPVRNFYIHHKNELSDNPDDNVLILLGDVSANYFFNERDNQFKNKLEKLPFTYFCIRGNHEERPSVIMETHPHWHLENRFDGTVYVENAHPHILYTLDGGSEYEIDNKSVLVIPGAYSVDKELRLNRGWSWFKGEQLTEKEKTNILNDLDSYYDVILSHTCPYRWQHDIKDLFLGVIDQSKVDTSMEKFLDEVTARTDWSRYYFGHYHDNRDIPIADATMLFHLAIPFGLSILEYQRKSFDIL